MYSIETEWFDLAVVELSKVLQHYNSNVVFLLARCIYFDSIGVKKNSCVLNKAHQKWSFYFTNYEHMTTSKEQDNCSVYVIKSRVDVWRDTSGQCSAGSNEQPQNQCLHITGSSILFLSIVVKLDDKKRRWMCKFVCTNTMNSKNNFSTNVYSIITLFSSL